MDNPQQKMEFSWLAGFFEADGCVSISVNASTVKHRKGFKPFASLVNTDLSIMNRIVFILDKYRLPYHFVTGKPDNRYKKGSILYRVEFVGLKRVRKFIPYILDYLYGEKRMRCIKVLEFINSRLSRHAKTAYNQEEIDLIQFIRKEPLSSEITEKAMKSYRYQGIV